MILDNENAATEAPVGRLLVPVFLVVLSFFLLVAFQAAQLILDHNSLAALFSSQEPIVQDGIKQRNQIETLAGKAAQLAADGNAAARAVVDNMRQQGITLTPPAER